MKTRVTGKMDKKAQITVFMVIGIIILVISALFLYVRSQRDVEIIELEETAALTAEARSVKNFVEECLKKVSEEALIDTGLKGGYYRSPSLIKPYFGIMVPFYLYLGQNKMPSKETIAAELSAYLSENIKTCTDGFAVFKDQGYDVAEGNASTITTIGKQNVFFKLTYPLTINQKTKISEFAIQVPSNLDTMYSAITSLVSKDLSNPDNICLSCMVNSGDENNLNFKIIYLPGNSALIKVKDTNPPSGKNPYYFFYAYQLQELPEAQPVSIALAPLTTQNAVVGSLFSYQVEAAGYGITFSDDSDLFDINPQTGLIEFIPLPEHKGYRTALIEISDAEGNYDYGILGIDIKEAVIPLSVPQIEKQYAEENVEFTLQINAEGNDLTYSLLMGPSGMTIDSRGILSWTPPAGSAGQATTVKIKVKDAQEESVERQFEIEVQ